MNPFEQIIQELFGGVNRLGEQSAKQFRQLPAKAMIRGGQPGGYALPTNRGQTFDAGIGAAPGGAGGIARRITPGFESAARKYEDAFNRQDFNSPDIIGQDPKNFGYPADNTQQLMEVGSNGVARPSNQGNLPPIQQKDTWLQPVPQPRRMPQQPFQIKSLQDLLNRR